MSIYILSQHPLLPSLHADRNSKANMDIVVNLLKIYHFYFPLVVVFGKLKRTSPSKVIVSITPTKLLSSLHLFINWTDLLSLNRTQK